MRKARISDVKDVQALINGFAKNNKLIPRSLSNLYERLRDITVYEKNGEVLGTCSLHIAWEDLAEIRSLAVMKDKQKHGIGKLLVRDALKEARQLGIKRVFALTFSPEYFKSQFGFREVDKSELPNKIWGDCIHCHMFPNCNETAVMLDIDARKGKR